MDSSTYKKWVVEIFPLKFEWFRLKIQLVIEKEPGIIRDARMAIRKWTISISFFQWMIMKYIDNEDLKYGISSSLTNRVQWQKEQSLYSNKFGD